MNAMKTIPCVLIGLTMVLAGCTRSMTPHYDTRFGDAVREARQKMIIDSDAGKNRDSSIGMDGKAARDSIIVYQETFRTPPPTTNVINIGGSIGGK